MMNYMDFKTEMIKEVSSVLPRKLEVELREVYKVNEILDGIIVIDREKDESISPTIYLQQCFDDYQNNFSFETVLSNILKKLNLDKEDVAMENVMDGINLEDKEGLKSKIIVQLINTNKNTELLSKVPHREILDLSIIYRILFNTDGSVTTTSIVNNTMVNHLGITEDELYKIGILNSERMLPSVTKRMLEILKEMLIGQGTPAETIDLMIDSESDSQAQYVISNSKSFNGAACILYNNNPLKELADKINSDLYILPSSIHEVIVIPAIGDSEDLSKMVTDINATEVSNDEVLSNSVYLYNRETDEITIATN